MPSNEKNKMLQELHDLLFVQHTTLTPRVISHRYQVHLSEATTILEDFVKKQQKKKDKLLIQYQISGSDDEGHIVLHRVLIVDECELDSYNSMFAKPTVQVYSVSPKDQKPKVALDFEQFIYEPNMDNLSKVQSFSYISNPRIKIRPVYRESLAKKLKYNSFKCVESIETTVMECEEVEPAPEPMSVVVEVSSERQFPMAKPKSQKKRSFSKDDTKRYKRVRVLDSDDEDEDVKMKENVQAKIEVDEEFKVTKLDTEAKKEPPKNVIQADSRKKDASKSDDVTTQQIKDVLKVKTQTQTSIMSFFKKK